MKNTNYVIQIKSSEFWCFEGTDVSDKRRAMAMLRDLRQRYPSREFRLVKETREVIA